MKGRKKPHGMQRPHPRWPGPTHEVIARLAELLWEKEGRPAGRDVEFWLRAEAELRETNAPIRHEAKS